MDKFIIHGGKKLKGTVQVSGAKNASLALMPAALLNSGRNKLYNTPELNDVYTMLKLLSQMGVKFSFSNHILELNTTEINSFEAPYEHVKKMRASIYVLGPLVARYGYAKVSMPGGCAWGPRPVNLHLMAMEKLGAEITFEQGYIIASANKLKGNYINFDIPSVGATGNTLMAAVLAKGNTIINNAACEPEITNLCNFLIKMGAKIEGVGTSIIEVEGVDELHPADIETIPDRIEAGTLLIAGAITRSNIKVIGGITNHLHSILSKLEDSGCKLFYNKESIEINSENIEIKPIDVTTAVFPGFPTDMQAQWMAYMSLAVGTSNVTDTIYKDRFNHVPELVRLGVDIVMNENTARIVGVEKLKGAKVMSTDLRASASLVLAGLAAEGVTEVLRVYHIDRGYQRIEEKLKELGADIERVEGSEY
ncbi:UDP-N-acetylglucosamine 1-carboxyvinyltransferase [Ignavibacterium sp.]|uniref:UDP-N-acetylglucosamine 1-carboxyvinyltransferase n=1 Tax=Ignavibacterium sp. TaxID=2651167 RepID=UPI00307FB892